ncbi:hypothetical protein [Phaeospirillum tilakii]|uniref:Poly A polymerase head domain-containing protein n=1 Tax=Phaeospirillum tilakii TaxID=741673 RepID=A0ABW5CGG7_9PROT
MSRGGAFESIEILSVAGTQRSPTLLKDTPHVTTANDAFRSVLEKSDRLSSALANLESAKAQYCVFGGWLRDTLAPHTQASPPPRDVDLVVADVDIAALVDLLPSDVRPTIFGGIQSSAPPVPFDIWPLHETFLIRTLKLPTSFVSLLQTTDFDINAALYFPAQGGRAPRILEAGMLSALIAKQISFNASHLPFPVLQCARLAAYAAKLEFSFSPPVLDFMRMILASSNHLKEVVAGLERYHKGPMAEKAIDIVTSIVEGRI